MRPKKPAQEMIEPGASLQCPEHSALLFWNCSMPVRPRPFTLICIECNWTRTFAPISDALADGRDIVTHCPKCQSRQLRCVAPSTPALIASWLKRLLSSG